jgi:hypothetical protein
MRNFARFSATFLSSGLLLWACVGDSPNVDVSQDSGTPVSEGGVSDGSIPSDGGADAASLDASTDAPAPPRCDPMKAFGAPTPIAELNSSGDERSAWFSPDETRVYITRAAGSGPAEIYFSARTDRNAAFSDPSKATDLTALNTADSHDSISLTSDELSMYASQRVSPNPPQLVVSTRATKSAPFPAFASVGFTGQNPSGALSPHLTRDGAKLYFVNFADFHLSVGKATSATTFEPFTAVSGLAGAPSEEVGVVLPKDGLRIYFGSRRNGNVGGTTAADIFTATRSSTTVDFDPPTALTALSSDAEDYPASLSDDGCVLYMVSSRAGGTGGTDIWKAQRPQ